MVQGLGILKRREDARCRSTRWPGHEPPLYAVNSLSFPKHIRTEHFYLSTVLIKFFSKNSSRFVHQVELCIDSLVPVSQLSSTIRLVMENHRTSRINQRNFGQPNFLWTNWIIY